MTRVAGADGLDGGVDPALLNDFFPGGAVGDDDANVFELPPQSEDQFVPAQDGDPTKSKGDESGRNMEAEGFLAGVKSLLNAIKNANQNVNPHPMAQMAKWQVINDLALRAVSLVQRAVEVATVGSQAKSNAIALNGAVTSTASQASGNNTDHQNSMKETMKAERDPGQLSSSK